MKMKVYDYAVYENGKWNGEVIHNLMPSEKKQYYPKKLVGMALHFKIQNKKERRSGN